MAVAHPEPTIRSDPGTIQNGEGAPVRIPHSKRLDNFAVCAHMHHTDGSHEVGYEEATLQIRSDMVRIVRLPSPRFLQVDGAQVLSMAIKKLNPVHDIFQDRDFLVGCDGSRFR